MSSLGGRIASPSLTAYQSAKWAVGGFSTGLAQEVAPFGIKVTVLERGRIRTDWAGSSMNIPAINEPYQETVGAFAEFLRDFSGKEPSLPEKIARIIIGLSEADDVSLRLLIGTDAVEYAAKAAEKLSIEDKKCFIDSVQFCNYVEFENHHALKFARSGRRIFYVIRM
ncbi:Oxidoreductase boa17 [Orbilia oligospora]|uniref:Oxidoreductase boa17 n=1 Tax=Orbilia oligospora TaxID=2813651 RepID=A0A8H2E4J5_ORBOL|nr:Oxidoreductase boa17 [Orbilia oligospora]